MTELSHSREIIREGDPVTRFSVNLYLSVFSLSLQYSSACFTVKRCNRIATILKLFEDFRIDSKRVCRPWSSMMEGGMQRRVVSFRVRE